MQIGALTIGASRGQYVWTNFSLRTRIFGIFDFLILQFLAVKMEFI